MRRINLKAWILSLTLVGLAASANTSFAQQTLIDYSKVWKYFTNGTDLGTAWSARAYSDTAWPSGAGLLGVEDNQAQYAVPFNTVFPQYRAATITYYFRTHFTFSGNPAGYTLISSNFVDDGAVFYLNGVEAARIRVPTNQTYLTVSPGGTEGVSEMAIFPASALVQGDNVVAVEVHQSGEASTDIVFGMKLIALPPAPIVITSQPQSQTVTRGFPATFTVGVSGSSPAYQWYSNSVPLSGAVSPTYTINNAQPFHQATYSVRASNVLGSVPSANAVLTVEADNYGPLLVQALIEENATNRVIVTFNEALFRPPTNSPLIAMSPFNPSNYSLTILGATDKLTITNILVTSTQVRLTVSTAFVPGQEYVLAVTNLADSLTNSILPNSRIGLSYWRGEIFPMEGFWKSHAFGAEPGIGFNAGPSNPKWNQPSYEDSSDNFWSDYSPALFAFTDDPLPAPKGTSLSIGFNAYYFRTSFVITNMVPQASFRLRHIIDDGVILYFNGVEIHRFNLAAGAPTYGTFATNAVGIGALSSLFTVNVTNFVSGTNVLAAEVHQSAEASSDVVFGARIESALFTPILPPLPAQPQPLRLNIVRLASTNNQVRLFWSESGVTLLSATNPNGGPWTTVTTTGTNYNTTATGVPRYYRLRKP